MRTGRPETPIEDRFFQKVNIKGKDECWEWTGCRHPQGYGLIKRKDGAQMRPPRISWNIYNGKIQEGLCVCHKCDNPGCVNPNHLFLGTHKDNAIDKVAKGRMKPSPGEKNGASKLTEQQVLSIYKDARVQDRIAKDYGVCQTLISMIKLRKRWKTITNNEVLKT